ncbi:TPA: hypothetical protein JBC15_12625 [Legionella pneumophila subsp. pneumophila]|nr:hypothetical protein [Legionella pneumophila subsp. pneumophila]HAT9289369.1 hypothetical protein [Legionella pneumophila subsp. pneumophila]
MNFSSNEIQLAFEKAKPVIENITHIKNTISEEIKFIEKFFQSHAISENHTLQIRDPSLPCNVTKGADEGLVANEELLIWDAEKKRIIFQHNQYIFDDYICYESAGTYVEYDVEGKNIISSRPLIEMPFDVRKKVYEFHLSKFLLDISSRYKLNEKSSSPF